MDGANDNMSRYVREVALGYRPTGDAVEFAVHGRAALAVDHHDGAALVVLARHPDPDEEMESIDQGQIFIEEILLTGRNYGCYAGGSGTVELDPFETYLDPHQNWPASHMGTATMYRGDDGRPLTYSTLRVHHQIQRVVIAGRDVNIQPGGWAAAIGDPLTIELIDRAGQPHAM